MNNETKQAKKNNVSTMPGGRFRRLVWADRFERRANGRAARIDCIRAADTIELTERVATFTCDSNISFRSSGDFAAVWGVFSNRDDQREIFLSSYAATAALDLTSMVLPKPRPAGQNRTSAN